MLPRERASIWPLIFWEFDSAAYAKRLAEEYRKKEALQAEKAEAWEEYYKE